VIYQKRKVRVGLKNGENSPFVPIDLEQREIPICRERTPLRFAKGRQFFVTKVSPLAPIDRGSGGCSSPQYCGGRWGFISPQTVQWVGCEISINR